MEDEYSSRSGSQSTAIPPDQIGGLTRFYEKEFPDLEECVIVKVRSVAGETPAALAVGYCRLNPG